MINLAKVKEITYFQIKKRSIRCVLRERVRMAQRQNDTVVKSTRCVTLAQRQNDTVCQFDSATK